MYTAEIYGEIIKRIFLLPYNPQWTTTWELINDSVKNKIHIRCKDS